MSEQTAVELSPEALEFANFMAGLAIPESELDAMRIVSESVHLTAREPEGVTYREVDAGGVLGIWCEPVGANTDYVLLHGHAGGSVLSSAFVDRKLAGHIAKAAGAPVLVLDFRRAPEHKYPAQVDDTEAAFNWLLSKGYEPGNIITIGHSIGGFIAVALALRLRDKKLPLPGAIVSISPWCDLEIANETMVTKAETDKILSRELLQFFRDAWIGGTGIEVTDTRINLNRADLNGLPRPSSHGERTRSWPARTRSSPPASRTPESTRRPWWSPEASTRTSTAQAGFRKSTPPSPGSERGSGRRRRSDRAVRARQSHDPRAAGPERGSDAIVTCGGAQISRSPLCRDREVDRFVRPPDVVPT